MENKAECDTEEEGPIGTMISGNETQGFYQTGAYFLAPG